MPKKYKKTKRTGNRAKRKKAIITGITGQDGSYLAEHLLEKGYEVHGIVRRASTFNHQRIEHIYDYVNPGNLKLHYGDLTDPISMLSTIAAVRPDEIYNLAAQSHVQVSFEKPVYTAHADAIGLLNILEAVRHLKLPAKIYQASTSQMFRGDINVSELNEETPFQPRSPYGAAKLYAYHIGRIYRESYEMFIVNGILFNHESERRGENFVTRKITIGIAEILAGKREHIRLGNLDAERDWGHAEDFVRAMHLMLQQKTPKDYVIATGRKHSVREFCERAFKEAEVKLIWKGRGLTERGIDAKTKKTRVVIDLKYFRPNEVRSLRGNANKARRELGWKPEISFEQLVKRMVHHDLTQIKK